MRGRRIAFDFGEARIGVAICDPDGILATPLPYVEARKPKVIAEIVALCEEYQPITIFLGRPTHLSGAAGESVAKVDEFAARISEKVSIPIVFIDERLSTVDAQRRLREAGKNAKESRQLVDSMAAVMILETGLLHEKD